MTPAAEPQTDREWLIRIDSKVDVLLVCQHDHEIRIREISDRQNRGLGRDGVISAIIAVVVSIVTATLAVFAAWRP